MMIWRFTLEEHLDMLRKRGQIKRPRDVFKLLVRILNLDPDNGPPGTTVGPITDGGMVHVRTEGGKLLGILRVGELQGKRLLDIGVREGFRGLGIGTYMVHTARAEGYAVDDQAGVTGLTLDGARFRHKIYVEDALMQDKAVEDRVVQSHPSLWKKVAAHG